MEGIKQSEEGRGEEGAGGGIGFEILDEFRVLEEEGDGVEGTEARKDGTEVGDGYFESQVANDESSSSFPTSEALHEVPR